MSYYKRDYNKTWSGARAESAGLAPIWKALLLIGALAGVAALVPIVLSLA
jgi:hypothetical protein